MVATDTGHPRRMIDACSSWWTSGTRTSPSASSRAARSSRPAGPARIAPPPADELERDLEGLLGPGRPPAGGRGRDGGRLRRALADLGRRGRRRPPPHPDPRGGQRRRADRRARGPAGRGGRGPDRQRAGGRAAVRDPGRGRGLRHGHDAGLRGAGRRVRGRGHRTGPGAGPRGARRPHRDAAADRAVHARPRDRQGHGERHALRHRVRVPGAGVGAACPRPRGARRGERRDARGRPHDPHRRAVRGALGRPGWRAWTPSIRTSRSRASPSSTRRSRAASPSPRSGTRARGAAGGDDRGPPRGTPHRPRRMRLDRRLQVRGAGPPPARGGRRGRRHAHPGRGAVRRARSRSPRCRATPSRPTSWACSRTSGSGTSSWPIRRTRSWSRRPPPGGWARWPTGSRTTRWSPPAWPRRAPVVVAPAMDGDMWTHRATRDNVERLERDFGYRMVPPEIGSLASGRPASDGWRTCR